MSDAAADLIPLNRSEHMYWAGEGYLGPINQPYLLHFNQSVDEVLVRQTLRELVTAFPRLRGVIEPTALSYRLRILPDGEHVQQLFAESFRVLPHLDATDPIATSALHNEYLNQTMSLERGLPWRAAFVPHGSQPALVFSVHHITGDGRSMVQMLCAIMARLNGQPIAPCKLDSPSMLPAVLPLKWTQWPGSIARWWRQSRQDKRESAGQRVVTLASRRSTRFTTSNCIHHALSVSADTMKALAKRHNTSINTLMTAVIANCFLQRALDDNLAVAAIRISVDLRRYYPQGQAPEFGNYVSSVTLRASHQGDLAAQIASIEAQVKVHLARFERGDYALPLLFYEWLPAIGRTLYSHLIVKSKARGTLPELSCHISNLGSAEFINPKGAALRLNEMWPATLSTVLLMGLHSLNGQQFMVAIHQLDEIDAEAVHGFIRQIDQALSDLAARG